jgi:hypothetical protein
MSGQRFRPWIKGAVLSGAVACITNISPAAVTVIKAGRLLDPRSGNALSSVAVLIEDNKIKEVGSAAQVQAHAGRDVKTIDLGGATLLPGLIDGHTHLFLDIVVPPEAERQRHENGIFAPGLLLAIVESPTKRALMGAIWPSKTSRAALQLFETSVTPESMATLNCVMRSKPVESLAQGFWRLGAS